MKRENYDITGMPKQLHGAHFFLILRQSDVARPFWTRVQFIYRYPRTVPAERPLSFGPEQGTRETCLRQLPNPGWHVLAASTTCACVQQESRPVDLVLFVMI